jgi:lysozyme
MRENRWANLSAMLKAEEARKNTLYLDTATPPRITGGIGHNFTDDSVPGIPALVGFALTDDQVDHLFEADLNQAIEDVRARLPWAIELCPARFDALAALAFQLGINGLLGFKKMLAAFQRGDFDSAETELWNSRMAKQIGDGKGGKQDRLDRLAALIRTGDYPNA